ncbi:MAG TPA: lipopolysaccharide heptosyltransferase II [Pyrinomonadaceae bacterium]|nr:lipopolysaccharide heptosyltransferase II [Pyrinomonadaceae bacterium]
MLKGRRLRAEEIERVVVRGTNWVGDAVMSVPALRELRRILPDAHITLATRSSSEAIFKDADFIDEILIYDRQKNPRRALVRQIKEWRAHRFDCAVLFQNAFEAALIAFLARVPVRTGYATQGRRSFLTHSLKRPEWYNSRHEIFYYLNIVSEFEKLLFGSSEIEKRAPEINLEVSEARRAEAAASLRADGIILDRPLVALCPGSTNSRAKRWPADRFAAIADKFIEEARASVIIIGSPGEAEVSHEVSERMRNRAKVLTGQTTLDEAVAILSLVDLLVTNDTGPAHIASALNRPTLVIFGPTDPVTTRPFSKTAEIIRRPPDCAPCLLRDCPIDHRCMTAITPDEVFARALVMMRWTSAEARA